MENLGNKLQQGVDKARAFGRSVVRVTLVAILGATLFSYCDRACSNKRLPSSEIPITSPPVPALTDNSNRIFQNLQNEKPPCCWSNVLKRYVCPGEEENIPGAQYKCVRVGDTYRWVPNR